ncbi:MAG: SgcJ/EcaC family oxidoreductase [Flavisolibacter sp.]
MKCFIIALLLLMVSFNSKGQAADSVNIKDEGLIKKVLTDFTDAWNKHDAEAFSNVFSEDADFTNVRGISAHGRSQVEKFHAPRFTTTFKDTYQKITQSKIRFIKPDVAAVDAWWEMAGVKSPEGQDMPPRKGLLNFIMTKNSNTWLITIMHNMDLPASQ